MVLPVFMKLGKDCWYKILKKQSLGFLLSGNKMLVFDPVNKSLVSSLKNRAVKQHGATNWMGDFLGMPNASGIGLDVEAA